MPAYNFKSQFVPLVESGVKKQTIRPTRKHPTRPGKTLQLYTGMRTKKCRLLRTETCTHVKPVQIYATCIVIDGKILSQGEAWQLAEADGFKTLADFYDFFRDTYGLSETRPITNMELIQWD